VPVMQGGALACLASLWKRALEYTASDTDSKSLNYVIPHHSLRYGGCGRIHSHIYLHTESGANVTIGGYW
jgi:hypothetical protein